MARNPPIARIEQAAHWCTQVKAERFADRDAYYSFTQRPLLVSRSASGRGQSFILGAGETWNAAHAMSGVPWTAALSRIASRESACSATRPCTMVGLMSTTPIGRGIVLACQGGGSHTAFTAGVLAELLVHDNRDIRALSGTSGGAVCVFLA